MRQTRTIHQCIKVTWSILWPFKSDIIIVYTFHSSFFILAAFICPSNGFSEGTRQPLNHLSWLHRQKPLSNQCYWLQNKCEYEPYQKWANNTIMNWVDWREGFQFSSKNKIDLAIYRTRFSEKMVVPVEIPIIF